MQSRQGDSYAVHLRPIHASEWLIGTRGFDPARETALPSTSDLSTLVDSLVGARGFEPPTTGTPCRCATRLRYAPNNGGWNRSRTGVHGFAGRCMTTLPSSQMTLDFEKLRGHVTSTCPLNFSNKIWSGKRDSNSRPRPWQGRALPAELFPLKSWHILCFDRFLSTPTCQKESLITL